ncbi:MAG: ice-binding family protein [Ginsengibacter sp.]
MKKKIRFLIGITLLSFPKINFAQAPNLGTTANFVLFSTTGAIGNTGVSHITGNVGTNTGAITSFSNVDGVMHSPDATTSACASDLLIAYNQLNTAIPTSSHAVLLGNGETLKAGVYSVPAAASVNNSLTLDAQGNENAVFIFQIGGAFSSGAFAQINLINCAKASNVFWKVEGAVSFAAGTFFRGTIIANNAAIALGAGVTLEGRALSTTGAVAVNNVLAYLPYDLSSPLVSGPTPPPLASTACYALFSSNGLVTNNDSTSVVGDIGTNFGSTTGYNALNVTGTIHAGPDGSTSTCAADLLNVYNDLNTIPVDIQLLYPAQFGNSLVLTPHSYLMNGAVTFTDTLFLNAQGNANAVFFINANGPLSTGTNAQVVLINGAHARNVYWKVEGAVTIGNNSNFKGTIICNNGAIILGSGALLEGRAFTTGGALTTNAIIVTAVPAASIFYARYSYCSNGGTASVTLSGAAGGIYSSTTGLVIDSSTGNVNLGGSSPGTYTVTYTTGASGGCSISQATAVININTGPFATLSYAGSPFCTHTGIAPVTFTGTSGGVFSSSPAGASIDSATGTLNLAGSIPGTYLVSYTISRCSGGCGSGDYTISTTIIIHPNIWSGGISTDWNTPGNWLGNALPALTCPDVTIPATPTYQPILNSGAFAIQNLIIDSGATLTINNAILQIAGTINNSGIFNVFNGSIDMNGSSAQIIPGNAFTTNTIHNLIISNDVSLEGEDSLTGVLSFGAVSSKTFTTGGFLTLKSSASGTANVADITNNNLSSGNRILGRVIVERYISAHKGWWFLSIPTGTFQTVRQSWQEAAGNIDSNLVPGYGTQITGPGGNALGFDLYTATPSMKTYQPLTNSWKGIPNTTPGSIKDSFGYMVFIRGDRTANAFNSTSTPTVLRTKGNLFTGDQNPILIAANMFASIGNPFASQLDMRNIGKWNLKDFFYLWDPYLAGSEGLGGYQTFSNGGGHNYIITPGGGSYDSTGSVSNFIESGQAFFVQADSVDGSLTFNEAAKTGGTGQISVAARVTGQPKLVTSLYAINSDHSASLVDGVRNDYDDRYSNKVDEMDAIKLTNTSENLSIKTGNTLLVIERRHGIAGKDTIFLNLTGTKVQQYRFQFTADKMELPGLTAFLEDNYLHTSTPLNLNGTTAVNFNIVNVQGSYATDRFRIVFTPAFVLPLSFTSVNAYQVNGNIAVEWKMENEENMKQYEVEKSLDGNHYIKTNTFPANHSKIDNYNWLDTQVVAGYNYYRIKSVNINGEKAYSIVMKVDYLKVNGSPSINVYPNPIANNRIWVRFNNIGTGIYILQLFNTAGQLEVVKIIRHIGSTPLESFETKNKLAAGKYELKLAGHDIRLTTAVIKG